MRIIHLAPVIAPLHPKAPGGAELMVVELSVAQSRRSLPVTVIAADHSEIPEGPRLVFSGIQESEVTPVDTSQKVSWAPDAVKSLLDHDRHAFCKLEEVLRATVAESREPCIVHNHAFDYTPLFELPRLDNVSYLHTLHCMPLTNWHIDGYREYGSREDSLYVTVSDVCADAWERESGRRPLVVPNGIEVLEVPFSESPGQEKEKECVRDEFIWVGRISREKGLHHALDLVERNPEIRLKVIGRVYDQAYFSSEIEKRLTHERVEYLGFLPRAQVFLHLSRSKALIAPLDADEPFGLIFIESLAAGTPVITFNRGSAPSILKHGMTGLLCESMEDFQESLRKVGSMSRKACRASAEKDFSLDATVEKYLELYRAILSESFQVRGSWP